MSHTPSIQRALNARKTDIKKVMASADLTLSQKALRGRTDVSQSLMCLRVANKLRKLTYTFDIPLDVIHEQTGISMKSLLDVDCRSVLISVVKLAVVELALDAYQETVDRDYEAHLRSVKALEGKSTRASAIWKESCYDKSTNL